MGFHGLVEVISVEAKILAGDGVGEAQAHAAAVGQARVGEDEGQFAPLGREIEVAHGEFVVAHVLKEGQARVGVFVPPGVGFGVVFGVQHPAPVHGLGHAAFRVLVDAEQAPVQH